MNRRARTDANQRELVTYLRSVGASVAPTHAVGEGFPDLVVGWRGKNYLIEVKDGTKPPSARRLTPAQERWHAAWRGRVDIVESLNDIAILLGFEYNDL